MTVLKLKQKTPPNNEPVSLGDVKKQLQIEISDTLYDDQLNALIPAAREWCESYQNRAYITQKLELALNEFPCSQMLRLPRPPLQTIDSVNYKNADGVSIAWSSTNYEADTYSEPGNLVCITEWPQTNNAVNNVIVTYTAGYGDAQDDVPVTIKQAIILLVVHWFNNGLCDPPNAVYALLDLERVIPV